jgi:hypothetical protein
MSPEPAKESQKWSKQKKQNKHDYHKCLDCPKQIPTKFAYCIDCGKGEARPQKSAQPVCTISGPLEFVNDLVKVAREPTRQAKNDKLVLDAVADEIVKNQPALDSVQDAPPAFSPDYTIHSNIKICDVTDISVFGVLAEMFVDTKTNQMKAAIETFSVPELVLPTIELGKLWEKYVTGPVTEFLNDDDFSDCDLSCIRSDLIWDDIDEEPSVEILDLKNLDKFALREEDMCNNQSGNIVEVLTAVFSETAKIVDPILDIINPMNYVRLSIKASQVQDVSLCARFNGYKSVDDTRCTDLRENQPLTPDTIVSYKQYIKWSYNGCEEYPSAAYFPEVSYARHSHFNRLFYSCPEPDYKQLMLSMNLLTELYHAKTCFVNPREDSVVTLRRLFKTNPHNTFASDALLGDRVMEDNYQFSLRFCMNEYRPNDVVDPVK